ncbi:MAG: site-2 protease family protein [Microthrixaceae bacterium]
MTTTDRESPLAEDGSGDELGESASLLTSEPCTASEPEAVESPWSRWIRLALLVAAIVALGVTQGASMLIVVAAIVFIIFMHELGHFVMARRAGMLATEFFIGFGPRIFSFRKGETEYGLKAIPAGAYVRIIGMSSLEEVDPSLESRTYRQGRFWDRIGVAVAGSTMHFIMAFVLLFSLFVFVGAPSETRWKVRAVTAGSAADAAGIRVGDVLLTFNGEEVSDFDSFRSQLQATEPGVATFEVRRGTETLDLSTPLSTRMKIIGTIGEDVDVIDSGSGPVIVDTVPDGVARKAGLKGGESLVAVNGTTVSTLGQVRRAVDATDGGTLDLTTRDSAGVDSTHKVDLGSAVAGVKPSAFLGVGEGRIMEPLGPVAAVGESAKAFAKVTKASVVGVGKFLWPPNIVAFVTGTVTGDESPDPVNHPEPAESTPLGAEANRPISIVGVALIGSDLTSEGISSLVEFLALVNIFFGVFNLFPMLPFDGGHVVIAIYERVREAMSGSKQRYMSDVSKMAPVAYVVVGVLVVVGLLAMFLDITKGVSL